MKLRNLLLSSIFIFICGCEFQGCEDSLSDNERVSPPVFSVVSNTSYEIDITTATDGATVVYTTDGTDPVSSNSAEKGNSLTAGILTKIKAYAYKDGMADSKTVCFSVPRSERTLTIEYSADGKVTGYSSSEKDINDRTALEVYYTGPGNDGKWYNEDDAINKSVIYTFNSDGITDRKNTYTKPGPDSEWFTEDDILKSYTVYEYTESKLTRETEYNSSDEVTGYTDYKYHETTSALEEKNEYSNAGEDSLWFTTDDVKVSSYNYKNTPEIKTIFDATTQAVTGTIEYSYSAQGILQQEVHKNASKTVIKTITHTTTDGDHCEFLTTLTYDETSGDLKRKSVYNALGSESSDALESYTDYEYHTRLSKETIHDGDTPATILESILYTYTDDEITKKTFYKKNNADPEYRLDYIYESDRLVRIEKFMQDDTDSSAEYRSFEYDETTGKKIKEILWMNPGNDTRTISMDITVDKGLDIDGWYTLNGTNYDLDGNLKDITVTPDESGKMNKIADILKDVFDNSRITLSKKAIDISGKDGGSCRINISGKVNGSTASIKVTYNFNAFKNTDYILNGSVTKEITVAIDTGEISQSTMDGTLSGSLELTDTDPDWAATDYIRKSHIAYEYNEDEKCIKETVYCSSGKDGKWDTSDDIISSKVIRTYTEKEENSGEYLLTEEDWTITCGNDYFKEFVYEDSKLKSIKQSRDFGTLTIITDDTETVISSRFTYTEDIKD